MKIYNYKKRWKWLLFFSATFVFVVIIFYSNSLIKNIAAEERRRISMWADAISYKAELVSYTEKFFYKIRIEEGKRALLLAQAYKKVNEASLYEDITFYSDIIQSNSTIPTIIVQQNGKIDYAVNDPDAIDATYISDLGSKIQDYDSIKIQYYRNQYNMIFYKESKIYSDLRIVIDNLVQSFFQEVVINSASVPVIITDKTQKEVIISGNIDNKKLESAATLKKEIEKMRSQNNPIKVDLPKQGTCYVFYEDSWVLTQLRFFPFLQFFIIFIFILVAYLLFSVARKSEQNQVWVGMSKETAHQLGTPISSLMAWTELLRAQEVAPAILNEIDKDVHRLETIAQRFSKIGSLPELQEENLCAIVEDFVSYLQTRISSKVTIKFNRPAEDIRLPLNRYLFEWVIENLCKNAVDAMNGSGVIIIDIIEDSKEVILDIADTGKGIPQNKFKTVFKPGYTSKSRGWGLGLTLAKRIIEQYHKGKLFVKSSVIDRGTVIRISLRK